MKKRITEVANVVRFIRKCGKFTSTWPPDPDATRIELIIREFFWWITFINVIGLLVPLLYGAYHYRHDLTILMKSLSELTALLEVFFNLILCKIQQQRLQNLLAEVTNNVINANKTDREVYQKYMDRYLPFFIVLGTSFFLTAVVFTFAPLFTKSKLPADAWYPFSIEFTTIRYGLYAMQVIAILHTGLGVTVDFMVSMMLWYTTARFELLEKGVRRVSDDSQLARCIADHQKLITFATEMNYAVRFVILKSNATMALASICGAFPLLHRQTLILVSQFMLFVGCSLLRLYVTAWPADDLAETSQKIAYTTYCTDWIEGSMKMRRAVLFMIQRSQRPLVVSVAGILPALTLTFYGSFISGTMSYFLTARAILVD